MDNCMGYLTNNYGLHHGHQYEILDQVIHRPNCDGSGTNSLLL